MIERKTVSVCVPTCNRPGLLREAIESCLAQTRQPNRIVVGDDSTNEDSAKMIAGLAHTTSIPIDYRRNPARLGQNGNVNSLFDRTTTSHLILLHDDDVLLANAVEDLLSCWDEIPDLTAAYGKQYVMSHNGDIDLNASAALNRSYFRTSERAGLQKNGWEIGLLQQFPNDGFMIVTSAARATRWRGEKDVGSGGDFDFGLRLGLTHRGFFFLDRFTMKYRVTETGSISGSKNDDAALHSYLILEELKLALPGEAVRQAEAARARKMAELAPRALMQAIRHGERGRAWRIYSSRAHGWRMRASFGGMRRLLLLLLTLVKR
jgi:glycosyltransferase involved in cell wall biosynthesis